MSDSPFDQPQAGPQPAPEPAAPPVMPFGPRRDWIGWTVVVLLGVLIIGLQLTEYFMQKPGEGPDLESETSLRFTLALGEAMRSVAPTSSRADANKSLDSAIRQTKTSALAKVNRSEDSAIVVVAVSNELKEPIPDAALKKLQGSKSKDLRGLAAAFQDKTLTKEEAAKAAAPFEKGSFSRKLAAAQLKEKAGITGARAKIVTAYDGFVLLLAIAGGGILLLAGVGAIIAAAAAAMSGKWPSLGQALIPSRAIDADRYALRFGVFLLGFIIVPVLVTVALNGLLYRTFVMAIAFGSSGVVFWAFLKVPYGGAVDSMRRIMGDLSRWPQHVAIGLGAYAANFPIILVLSSVVTLISAPFRDRIPAPSHPVNEMMMGGSALSLIGIFITAAVLAPIIEELTFRGVLFPALAKFVPVAGAMLLQGFLFAAIHPQGPLAWPMLMAIGVMGAFVSYKQGSILPAIVMHAAHNATLLAIGMNVF